MHVPTSSIPGVVAGGLGGGGPALVLHSRTYKVLLCSSCLSRPWHLYHGDIVHHELHAECGGRKSGGRRPRFGPAQLQQASNHKGKASMV